MGTHFLVVMPHSLVVMPHSLVVMPHSLVLVPHSLVLVPHSLVLMPHFLVLKCVTKCLNKNNEQCIFSLIFCWKVPSILDVNSPFLWVKLIPVQPDTNSKWVAILNFKDYRSFANNVTSCHSAPSWTFGRYVNKILDVTATQLRYICYFPWSLKEWIL